jgi:hypothetical protein
VSSTTESSDTSNFADIVTVALAWELSHLLGNCESLRLLNQVLDSNQRCLIWYLYLCGVCFGVNL